MTDLDKKIDKKIAGSPTASGFKNMLMEAMLRALPPDLRAKMADLEGSEVRVRIDITPPAGATLPPDEEEAPRDPKALLQASGAARAPENPPQTTGTASRQKAGEENEEEG